MAEVDLRYYVSRVNLERRRERDVFTVFSKCWESVVGAPCMNDKVAVDAEHWVRAVRAGVGPMVPDYVKQHFDTQQPILVPRATIRVA